MRRLVQVPWWLWSLVVALLFMAPTVLMPAVPAEVIPVLLIVGVVFGAGMGPLVAWALRRAVRETDELHSAAGSASKSEYRAAWRAAMRGRVPSDPKTRRAGARLAAQRADQMIRQRTPMLVIFGTILAYQAYMAVTQSAWHWVFVALAGFVLATQFLLPRHLLRNVERLKDKGAG